MAKNRTYIAIDLKSFYASVECRERGLDPLTTNLVVQIRAELRKQLSCCFSLAQNLRCSRQTEIV